MTLQSRLFAFVLVVVAVLGAAAWGYAQGSASPKAVDPTVLSAADIGFKPTGEIVRGKVVGRLVVRVNGEWKEAQFEHTVTPVR